MAATIPASFARTFARSLRWLIYGEAQASNIRTRESAYAINESGRNMHQRLKDVIDQLYHPVLQNGRQVFALSQADAEQLPHMPTVAIISITSPNHGPAALDGVEHLLRLEFHDVDFLNKALSARAKQKLPGAFTGHQAKLIRTFVENLPLSVHTRVTHCGGGFSRSCAVAVGLHRWFGYRVEADRLLQANPSVIQVLMRSPKEQQARQSSARGSV